MALSTERMLGNANMVTQRQALWLQLKIIAVMSN
jgi:hypothetical protein